MRVHRERKEKSYDDLKKELADILRECLGLMRAYHEECNWRECARCKLAKRIVYFIKSKDL